MCAQETQRLIRALAPARSRGDHLDGASFANRGDALGVARDSAHERFRAGPDGGYLAAEERPQADTAAAPRRSKPLTRHSTCARRNHLPLSLCITAILYAFSSGVVRRFTRAGWRVGGDRRKGRSREGVGMCSARRRGSQVMSSPAPMARATSRTALWCQITARRIANGGPPSSTVNCPTSPHVARPLD